MKKVKPKHGGKRVGAGRKPTGKDPLRGIRMPATLSEAIMAWARKQADKPGFSEAARRLLAKALGL